MFSKPSTRSYQPTHSSIFPSSTLPTQWSRSVSPTPRVAFRLDRHVARQERPGVVGTGNERVHDLAVGRDRRDLDAAVLVLDPLRLADAARPALGRDAIRLARVGDGHRDVAHAVAVDAGEARDLVVGGERAREDEAHLALAHHVRRAVADAGLRPCVSLAMEAEGVLVVVGALLGVPDPELDVVPALERHLVWRGHGWIVLGCGLRSFRWWPRRNGSRRRSPGSAVTSTPRSASCGWQPPSPTGTGSSAGRTHAGPSSPATVSATRCRSSSRRRARTSSAGSSRGRCSARRERPTTG